MAGQDTTPDVSAHTPGTAKGEEKKMHEGQEPGRDSDNSDTSGVTARNSTSINAEDEEPIDPKMPHMPPA